MKNHTLLTLLIFAGLVVGIVVGHLLHDPGWRLGMDESAHRHAGWLAAFTFVGDTIFMGLLKMLIIPLIAASVIAGVTSIGHFGALGRIGLKTLVYYFATMFIAVAIGLVLVTSLDPGRRIQEERAAAGAQAPALEQVQETARGGLLGVARGIVEQLIPTNIVGAAADGQPLPVITFSLFFGAVITFVGARAEPLRAFFEALFDVMMQMVHVVLWIAPVGVFSLIAWTVARIGLGVFTEAIGWYMLTVLVGLAIHGLLVLPLVMWLFTGRNPYQFFWQMREALMTALGTDSSSATLPVTMECAVELGGVSKKAAGFVLPLGSTVNMDGTALYEAVAVVFMAQAYGVDLALGDLLIIAVTATLAAVGAASIPSAGLVTMVIVVNAVNDSLQARGAATLIPLSAIGLIIGVDRFLDMCRTTINVWGDAVGAKIISHSEPDDRHG